MDCRIRDPLYLLVCRRIDVVHGRAAHCGALCDGKQQVAARVMPERQKSTHRADRCLILLDICQCEETESAFETQTRTVPHVCWFRYTKLNTNCSRVYTEILSLFLPWTFCAMLVLVAEVLYHTLTFGQTTVQNTQTTPKQHTCPAAACVITSRQI